MNSIALDVYRKVSQVAGEMSRHADNKTLRGTDIQAAVKLVLPGELRKHAITEAARAMAKYSQHTKWDEVDSSKN